MRKNYFLFLYTFIILALALILAAKPDYNWDMLPYMAVLEKMDGVKSFNQIHQDVYARAKKNLPPGKYNELIDQHDNYRKKMAENAYAFETQLPFFDIKPIYLITAFIFYKIGVSLNVCNGIAITYIFLFY